MLENKTTSQYFLEPYVDMTITLSNTENNLGTMSLDENGNYVNSGLIGDQIAFKCTTFSGFPASSYVLFHDGDNNILGMVGGTYNLIDKEYTNLKSDVIIKGQEVIYYKTDVEVEYKSFTGNSVTFDDLDPNFIFKVWLNGSETTSYVRVGDTVTFSAGTNTFGNNVFIYYYPNTQIMSGKSMVLHYYSPYKHEVTEDSELLLGFDVSGTATVSAGSNIITTSVDLTGSLNELDDIRLDAEVAKILYIDATTIKVDKFYTNSYSGEDIYFTPYKLLLNIDGENEQLNPTYYEFASKGIKMPVKIKESIANRFNFNYKINTTLQASCSIYNFINDSVEKYINDINRMRLIRAYYESSEIDRFIYLTNIRDLEGVSYSKGDVDSYTVSLEFEDRLTLEMNSSEDILGAGGLGNYQLIRG